MTNHHNGSPRNTRQTAYDGRVVGERPVAVHLLEFVEQARSLHQGAWVEFMQEDGETLRAKLTWVSPVTGIYLFTNRQGLKACDKTLQGLAAELRRGGARILDGAPLFERAVNCVIDGLRKQAVG